MIKGSYTVELSLLSPLILGVVVFILYVSIYFYNAGVMKIMAFSTALEAEKCVMYKEEEQIEFLEEMGQEKVEGKLLGMGEITTAVKIDKSIYTVGYKGKLALPFFTGVFLPDSLSWEISVESKSECHKEKDWIQNIRRIMKLGEAWGGDEA